MEIENKKQKEYHSSSHLLYSCQYHVIFCPKYRRDVLKDGVDERIKELFPKIAKKYNFEILEMEVMPDHIHLLIDCNPRFGIVNCVKRLKAESTAPLRNEFPTLKKRLPCLWTRSSFISTVGSVSLETVMKYIENQKNV